MLEVEEVDVLLDGDDDELNEVLFVVLLLLLMFVFDVCVSLVEAEPDSEPLVLADPLVPYVPEALVLEVGVEEMVLEVEL